MGTQIGRLTWEKPNGEWGLNGYDIKKVPGDLYGALCKLHNYEKTGLSPEQLKYIDKAFSEQAKELQQYRAIGTVGEFRELMAGLVGALGLQRQGSGSAAYGLEGGTADIGQGWKGHFADRFGKVE